VTDFDCRTRAARFAEWATRVTAPMATSFLLLCVLLGALLYACEYSARQEACEERGGAYVNRQGWYGACVEPRDER